MNPGTLEEFVCWKNPSRYKDLTTAAIVFNSRKAQTRSLIKRKGVHVEHIKKPSSHVFLNR
jgi:hypothetical protein